MTMARNRSSSGPALPAALICGSLTNADAQLQGPIRSMTNGLPASRCPRPDGQEALHMQQPVKSIQKPHSVVVQHILHPGDASLEDAGYEPVAGEPPAAVFGPWLLSREKPRRPRGGISLAHIGLSRPTRRS
jgi:hypothetical protein